MAWLMAAVIVMVAGVVVGIRLIDLAHELAVRPVRMPGSDSTMHVAGMSLTPYSAFSLVWVLPVGSTILWVVGLVLSPPRARVAAVAIAVALAFGWCLLLLIGGIAAFNAIGQSFSL